MKTPMQELFSKLEVEHPELFNVNTTEGKKFIHSYYKFIKAEKDFFKRAITAGKDFWYNEAETTERMNIIGQNGNDGEHYNK